MANSGPETSSSVLRYATETYDFGGLNFPPFKDRDWPMVVAIDPNHLNGDQTEVSNAARILMGAMSKELADLARRGVKKIVQDPEAKFPKKDPVGELEQKIFFLGGFIIDSETGGVPRG